MCARDKDRDKTGTRSQRRVEGTVTYAVLHGGREVTVGTADVEALLEVDTSSTSTRKTQKYHSSQYQHRGQRNLPDRRGERKRRKEEREDRKGEMEEREGRKE